MDDFTLASYEASKEVVASFDNDFMSEGKVDGEKEKVDGENEFELMHVKVTVLGLTGIIKSIKSKDPDSKRKFRKKKARGQSHDANESVTSRDGKDLEGPLGTASTASSLGSSGVQQPSKPNIPIVATIAFSRNVTNNQVAISTYLPSLPLEIPPARDRELPCIASWPAENHPFLLHKSEVDRASYSFSRIMMREQFTASDGLANRSASNFTSETMDLRISLSQGKDIIHLGIASLVITGNEEGAELMNLPAKAVTFKGEKMELGPQKKSGKLSLFKNSKARRTSFPSDPRTTYMLSENAMLRVIVKVLPSHAIEAAEAAEAAKVKEAFKAKRSFRRELESSRPPISRPPIDQDQENVSALGNTHPGERLGSFNFDTVLPRRKVLGTPAVTTLGCTAGTMLAQETSSVTKSPSFQSRGSTRSQRSRSSKSHQSRQQMEDAPPILSIGDYICGKSNFLPNSPQGAHTPASTDFTMDTASLQKYVEKYSKSQNEKGRSNPHSNPSSRECGKEDHVDKNIYIRLAKKGVGPSRVSSSSTKAVKGGF